MARPNPLQLPELLFGVLVFLGADRPSLFNAISVNRDWFEEATNVLWQFAPVEQLIRIGPQRRQLYAGKIYSLDFNGNDGQYHTELRSVKFPRLKRLSCDVFFSKDDLELVVSQYLQPSLEKLILYGGKFAGDVLDHVVSNCPRLRYLLIDNMVHKQPDQFLIFLQQCRYVDSMVFLYKMDHVVTDDTLQFLVGRSNLRLLELGRLFTHPTVERIFGSILDPPFVNLQRLSLRLEAAAIPIITAAIPKIKSLCLDVEDDNGSVLNHLASLHHLQVLEVSYRASREVPREEIITLRSLHDLRELNLHLHTSDVGELRALDLSDDDMEQLTSHFGQLSSLRFLMQNTLSVKCIVSIAKKCSLLNKLELLGEYHLSDLKAVQQPLLPNLQELDLGGARVQQNGQELYVYSS